MKEYLLWHFFEICRMKYFKGWRRWGTISVNFNLVKNSITKSCSQNEPRDDSVSGQFVDVCCQLENQNKIGWLNSQNPSSLTLIFERPLSQRVLATFRVALLNVITADNQVKAGVYRFRSDIPNAHLLRAPVSTCS